MPKIETGQHAIVVSLESRPLKRGLVWDLAFLSAKSGQSLMYPAANCS